MGSFKVRHLVKQPSGYYFQPSRHMRLAGFHAEPLGKDLHTAVERAEMHNKAWDEVKQGNDIPACILSSKGTMARLVEDLMASAEYRDKSQPRQTEIEYSLKTILPVFGPSRLDRITPSQCENFYGILRDQGSVHRAQRIMKDLRYLLNRAIRQTLINHNPALAFSVRQPVSRVQVWSETHVRNAIDLAWNEGFHGLAVQHHLHGPGRSQRLLPQHHGRRLERRDAGWSGVRGSRGRSKHHRYDQPGRAWRDYHQRHEVWLRCRRAP